MKQIFYDVNGKLSFGRIIGFFSIICSIVLFIVALSYNWYQVQIQKEIFGLVKFMWGAGSGMYGVSKILDKVKGNE